jgi:hypothetical protein
VRRVGDIIENILFITYVFGNDFNCNNFSGEIIIFFVMACSDIFFAHLLNYLSLNVRIFYSFVFFYRVCLNKHQVLGSTHFRQQNYNLLKMIYVFAIETVPC